MPDKKNSVKFLALTLLLACSLFLFSCDKPGTASVKHFSLKSEELRGRVIETDLNNSMVRVEVLACGEGLSKEWGGSLVPWPF